MTIRKALTLLALPALLIGGEAAARSPAAYQGPHASAAGSATITAVRSPPARGPRTGCPPFACGAESNGPALTGVRAPTGTAMQPRPRPNPIVCLLNPSACKLATNGPALTGARATTVVAMRMPGQRPPVQVGGSCPPFACGTSSNGPALTGVRAGSGAAPVGAVRLRPQGQPGATGRWCTRVTDWWTICW